MPNDITDLWRWWASRRLGIPESEVTPDQRREAKAACHASVYSESGEMEVMLG